jgi:GNAT superfamily N-acetyltransferase
MDKDPVTHLPERTAIRAVRADDAEMVAALSASFGYPTDASDMRSRIEELARSKDRMALAAVLQGVVVGWVDAAVERHLQSRPVVVIGGLVVRDDMRGQRIGRQLCHAVERWAVEIGIGAVRVRSQMKRAGAHRFYLREGYTQVKISAVFEKDVHRQT